MTTRFLYLKQLDNNRNIICFPHAGGSTSAYRPLCKYVQSDWNIIAVQPPGHSQTSDVLLTHIDEMVNHYLDTLAMFFTTPFILFGHSLGAMVVYRLACFLEARGITPHACFLSGASPPDAVRLTISDLPDNKFISFLNDNQVFPPEFMDYPDIVDHYLRIFRADYMAVESFSMLEHIRLQTVLHILSGRDDMLVPHDNVAGWESFSDRVHYHEIDGGHMFLTEKPKSVAKIVDDVLVCHCINQFS